MKRASISEAKNRLSALLDRVRQGGSVVIEDRGVPIARLEPVAASGIDPEGRLARLEREGVVRRPARKPAPARLPTGRPPRPRGGRTASDAIIEERRGGR